MAERPLHPVNREHLEAIGGPLGIWQHATGAGPNEAFGYCTDDVARALAVDLLHGGELGWTAVRPSARRSLRFLRDAFEPVSGRFRNFREADGSWIESPGSEDSQGRALFALGVALGARTDDAFTEAATSVFAAALPAARQLRALRATASAVLGCAAALDGGLPDAGLREATRDALGDLTARLRGAFALVELEGDWPWPEPALTYENALLPRALLVAGRRLGDAGLRRTGLRVLDWLIRVQTTANGQFSPIGNDRWWHRGGVRSRFDQQPIEATSMLQAAEVAFMATGEPRYLDAVERAYGWFLGDNDLGLPVADPDTGGCHDGLTPFGLNLNQGAESTLMWLTALEHLRRMRRDQVGFHVVSPTLARTRTLVESRR